MNPETMNHPDLLTYGRNKQTIVIHCEGCGKLKEKDSMPLFMWYDKNDYSRNMLCCRNCRHEAIELFKASETRFVQ